MTKYLKLDMVYATVWLTQLLTLSNDLFRGALTNAPSLQSACKPDNSLHTFACRLLQ